MVPARVPDKFWPVPKGSLGRRSFSGGKIRRRRLFSWKWSTKNLPVLRKKYSGRLSLYHHPKFFPIHIIKSKGKRKKYPKLLFAPNFESFLGRLIKIRKFNIFIWCKSAFYSIQKWFTTGASNERKVGFEPTTFGLLVRRSPNWATLCTSKSMTRKAQLGGRRTSRGFESHLTRNTSRKSLLNNIFILFILFISVLWLFSKNL